MNPFDTLRARGFVQQCTHEDEVRKAFDEGTVTFYVGFDPTADSMHIGHLLPVMAMAWLQRAGHRPIAVVGGGTAMVGDPSGKTELRKMLTAEQIESNRQAMAKQLARFLPDDNRLMLNNADWLLPLNYIAFLRDIGRHFSVNKMLTMEAYKLRLEREGSGLSFIEFNYQLLQAYDFLALYREYGCTLQMGGDDQWGNILAGSDLIRRMEGAQAWGLTFPLITTASGAKMGKTAAGAVWLDAKRLSPFDYYQYWINVDDADVGRFLKLYTFLDLDRIAQLEQLQGADIRQAKQVLAWEATALAHGADEADKAKEAAVAMVAGAASADLPTHEVGDERWIVAVLTDCGLAKSRGEARRLIQNGGVRLEGEKLRDLDHQLAKLPEAGAVLRVGKKRAVRVIDTRQ